MVVGAVDLVQNPRLSDEHGKSCILRTARRCRRSVHTLLKDFLQSFQQELLKSWKTAFRQIKVEMCGIFSTKALKKRHLYGFDLSRQFLNQCGGGGTACLFFFNASDRGNGGRVVSVKFFTDLLKRQRGVLTDEENTHMTRHCNVCVTLLSLDILYRNAVVFRNDLTNAFYRNGWRLTTADNIRDCTAAHIQRDGHGGKRRDRR